MVLHRIAQLPRPQCLSGTCLSTSENGWTMSPLPLSYSDLVRLRVSAPMVETRNGKVVT
jgi:hypothetical protein